MEDLISMEHGGHLSICRRGSRDGNWRIQENVPGGTTGYM